VNSPATSPRMRVTSGGIGFGATVVEGGGRGLSLGSARGDSRPRAQPRQATKTRANERDTTRSVAESPSFSASPDARAILLSMKRGRLALWVAAAIVSTIVGASGACGGNHQKQATGPTHSATASNAPCPSGRPMRVHFFDVGQGLAVLVTLPDGSSVLVDAADSPKRPGCGLECATADQRLLAGLSRDVKNADIKLMWITHQHSDHIGGATEVLQRFKVDAYVDNGRDTIKPMVDVVHTAAQGLGAHMTVVDPTHAEIPFADVPGVKLTPIVP